MQLSPSSRRAELLGSTLRRLLRRNATSKISRLLGRERLEDVAVALRRLTPAEQYGVFSILINDFPESAAEVARELEATERANVLELFAPEQVATLLKEAAVDDAVFIIESLPEDLKESVLEIVDLEDHLDNVQHHLAFEDDTAGRIMDSELVAMEQGTTVLEAIQEIRRIAGDIEMISYLYVTDQSSHLLGVASLRQLLLAPPKQTLSQIMNASMIKVRTDTDQEEVAQLAARYDLLAIPVVDDDNRLVGIVTVDDILDVFKEEATEDFYKMVGTSDDELVYQDNSWKVTGIRLPWILVNLVGLLLAGLLTTRFDQAFEIVFLIGFIPVIMGMAGNIGSQTSTIAVRGLATGRLTLGEGNIKPFLWQQLKVGALLGTICMLIVATVAFFLDSNPFFAIVVGLSLFLTIQFASLNGAVIPVLFRRLGVDPAVASGPLVTTSNDILGILIYFSIAYALRATFLG